MDQPLRISVPLATYGDAPFLEEQLESLIAQEHPPYEVVIGDDTRDDRLVGRLQAFANRAPFPVSYTRNEEQLGPTDNFLSLVTRCRGDAVAYCDQDDIWDRRKLAIAAARLSEHPSAGLYIHASVPVSPELRRIRRRNMGPQRNHTAARLQGDWQDGAYGHAMVARRRLLATLDPAKRPQSRAWDGPMIHDEWTFFIAFALTPIVYDTTPSVLYRVHEDNMVGPPPTLTDAISSSGREIHAGICADARRLCATYADFWHRAEVDEGGRAHRYFAAQAELWARRLRAANARSVPRHLSQLSANAAAGDYRARQRGGVGVRGLLRDMSFVGAVQR
jgi:glycosyltransferase involved in cell wall biosynthesis